MKNKKQAKNYKTSGFTLIELLVVIAIIGLLASVVLVALNGARAKSRDGKRIADMNQMAKAMELFYNEYNSYPTNSVTNYLVPTFMSRTPTAPSPADGTCTSGAAGNNNYVFSSPATAPAGTYVMTFCLGNTTGALSAGPHTLTQAGMR
jgi:prepilin-type N-terminal cleavage/methylation domain-containing protein